MLRAVRGTVLAIDSVGVAHAALALTCLAAFGACHNDLEDLLGAEVKPLPLVPFKPDAERIDACTACAVEHCRDEHEACAAEPACAALLGCRGDCADPACLARCGERARRFDAGRGRSRGMTTESSYTGAWPKTAKQSNIPQEAVSNT